MEHRIREYKEAFSGNHFFEKICQILNTLEPLEKGFYGIGYGDDGIIKPLGNGFDHNYEKLKKVTKNQMTQYLPILEDS